MDEELLITALRSGDQKAFKLLVDIYKRTGYNTVLDFVQHTKNAEEVTQEGITSL